MQFFDRNTEPAPACLSDQRTERARATLASLFSEDREIEQRRVSMEPFEAQDDELQRALERLFRDKCAFCEAQVQTSPYRFRPTEEAGPSGLAPDEHAGRSHLYYTWLTNAWQNIYPICTGCRPMEASIFPVRGKRCPLPSAEEILEYKRSPTGTWRGEIPERPLLLDPCSDADYRKHLAALPGGLLLPLSQRGAATIRHFNLDRQDLESSRARSTASYLDELLGGSPSPSLFRYEELPHGGTWYLLLHRLAKKLRSAERERPSHSRKSLQAFYEQQSGSPDFRRRLDLAYADLAEDPGQVTEVVALESTPPGAARPLRFRIRNFKAIEDLEVALPSRPSSAEAVPSPAFVIIGENAAGKSSILEAMALVLSDEGTRGDLPAGIERGLMLNPTLLGARSGDGHRPCDIEVDYEDGRRSSIRIDASGIASASEPLASRIPVYAYGAFRLYMDDARTGRRTSSIRSLFQPNYVLPNPEKWLATLRDTPMFNEVVRVLRYVLALDQMFDRIEFDEQGRCSLVLATGADGEAPVVTHTPLGSVSSGFRSVLSMTCDIMQRLAAAQGKRGASLARAHAVVLIDEVEAHLHPRWKLRIMEGLRQALPNVTFIVTTHDPLCLRGFAGSQVMVLRRVQRAPGAPGQLPEFVERLEELPVIESLTVEQLLTSDFFQLFSTDAPELEMGLAGVGDLVARARAGDDLSLSDRERVAEIRATIGVGIAKALPIGSTEVERLVQEAVEVYLVARRSSRASELASLRQRTRRSIVSALERL